LIRKIEACGREKKMASGEYNFPPQKQDTQPGKEYLMNPPPQYSSPDYKPSNKLQVYAFNINQLLFFLFPSI